MFTTNNGEPPFVIAFPPTAKLLQQSKTIQHQWIYSTGWHKAPSHKVVHCFCMPQYNTSWTSIIPCKQSRNAHTQGTEGKGSKPAQYWPFDFICFVLPGTGTIFSHPIQHQSLYGVWLWQQLTIYTHTHTYTHTYTPGCVVIGQWKHVAQSGKYLHFICIHFCRYVLPRRPYGGPPYWGMRY